jgi:hypothetical protein
LHLDDEGGHGRKFSPSFSSPTTSSPCKKLMIKASPAPLNLRFCSDKDMQNSFLMRIAAGLFAPKRKLKKIEFLNSYLPRL